MLSLSRKTDYAIIAMSHLAQHPDEVCGAREIADQFRIPVALLMNILKTLCRGEMVASTRGSKGGYRLAVSAEKITLADIIASVEGPLRFVQCVGHGDQEKCTCGITLTCPVMKPVQNVHKKLQSFLRTVTLADIAFDRDYGNSTVRKKKAVRRGGSGKHGSGVRATKTRQATSLSVLKK